MLGPYRIVRRLGFGGMGVVFEALDGTLNRPVALKVISSHLADDAGFRARFVREAQAQASVRSPHVVTVYAHGEADGRLYIATELVDAGDLGRLVQEHGAPPFATALDIIAQVASGLADAHAAGLVHRDIKPANVLLRRRQDGVQAYLADFGIARQVGAEAGLTMVGGTVGTPSYMAPELHTGGRAGIESDIYSLGCLLWAAMTGVPPFTGMSDYQIVSAHLERPVPQLRAGAPAADLVNEVLSRSLAKGPAARYDGAAAMSGDLREAAQLALRSGEVATPAEGSLAELSPPTRPAAPFAVRHPDPTPLPSYGHTPTPTPAGRPERRGRGVALVVAGVALALVAGGAVAFALTRGDEPSGRSGGGETSDPSDPTSSAPTTASSDPATPPVTPGAGDREKAVASLAAALSAQGGEVTEDIATCVAEAWIDGVGLEEMIAAGFFDEDMNYVDQPAGSISAEMRSVVTTAITQCTLGNLDLSP